MKRGSNAKRPARRDLPQPNRREDADIRDVRELILHATRRLLDSRRFETLSVTDILNEAGVARGSFYFYFANKHAVLAELVRRAVATGYEAAGAWTDDASGAPGAALGQGTAQGTRMWREHAPVLRAIVENWQSDPSLTRLWMQTMDGFTSAAADRILADRAGGLAADHDSDPRTVAAILCWMNERAWYLAAIGHPAFTDETRLAQALSEVWQAAIYGSPPDAAGPDRTSR